MVDTMLASTDAYILILRTCDSVKGHSHQSCDEILKKSCLRIGRWSTESQGFM